MSIAFCSELRLDSRKSDPESRLLYLHGDVVLRKLRNQDVFVFPSFLASSNSPVSTDPAMASLLFFTIN